MLQWFLSLILIVEVCVNVHALYLERRTRVLEAKFLIILHYGVWGRKLRHTIDVTFIDNGASQYFVYISVLKSHHQYD